MVSWGIFNIATGELVEGGFFHRNAAELYMEREYPEGHEVRVIVK